MQKKRMVMLTPAANDRLDVDDAGGGEAEELSRRRRREKKKEKGKSPPPPPPGGFGLACTRGVDEPWCSGSIG